MARIDARDVFQMVNILDGIVTVVASTHAMPMAPTLGAVAASQAALAAACLCPRCSFVGPTITSAPTAEAQVALTFDDGPNEALTPRILDILARYGAKASFFCIGARARRWPGLVRRAAMAGHSIENHSWRHSSRFALLGSHKLAREIDDTQELLADLCGRPPAYFRAPAGFRNPWLAPLLAQRALRYAAWSHRGFDTLDPVPARILQRVTHHIQPGAILLLHDGRNARDRQGRPVVDTVLPSLLQRLTARGLRAVDLPTLLGSTAAVERLSMRNRA